MTGEQIVKTSTEELEKMDDNALLEWVKPILEFHRPLPENIIPPVVKAPKEKKPKKEKAQEEPINKDQLSMEDILAQLTEMKEEVEGEN